MNVASADVSLVPLCTVDALLAERLVLPSTPSGTRAIVEVLSLQLSGPRLNARMKGHSSADWLTLSADGSIGTLDVRATLETDDGALLLMQYNGRVRFSGDKMGPIFVAPRFDTGDSRYLWLAGLQAVGKGMLLEARHLRYSFFELT